MAAIAGVVLLLCLLLQTIVPGNARGVLSIKLLSFENRHGRTYEGQCCDPTPQDDDTCHDQCDYVMRLIISGLGRANDHVFLFHRPLKYDSNDLHFQQHGGDLTLTVLFDRWPTEGHVKMNAFFYDYDDYDHTTALVDWFETELSGQGSVNKAGQHELRVSGNRGNDKTRLVFEWTRHCETGGPESEEEEDCKTPPPDWNLWPWRDSGESQDLEQQGGISSDDNQGIYYRNGQRSHLKSPFKPFSTRRQEHDSENSITFYTPNPLNRGHVQMSKPKEVLETENMGHLPNERENFINDYRPLQSPFKPIQHENRLDITSRTRLKPVTGEKAKDHRTLILGDDDKGKRLGNFPQYRQNPDSFTYGNPFERFSRPTGIAPGVLQPRVAAAETASKEYYGNSHRSPGSRMQRTMLPPSLWKKRTHHKKQLGDTSKQHPKQSQDVPGNVKNQVHKEKQEQQTRTSVDDRARQQYQRFKLHKAEAKQFKKVQNEATASTTLLQATDKPGRVNSKPFPPSAGNNEKQITKNKNVKPVDGDDTDWILNADDISTVAQKKSKIAKLASRQIASTPNVSKTVEDSSPRKSAPSKNILVKSSTKAPSTTQQTATTARPSLSLSTSRAVIDEDSGSRRRLNVTSSTNPSSRLNPRRFTILKSSTTTPSATTASRGVELTTRKPETTVTTKTTRSPVATTISKITTTREGWGPLQNNRFVTWIPATPASHWVHPYLQQKADQNTRDNSVKPQLQSPFAGGMKPHNPLPSQIDFPKDMMPSKIDGKEHLPEIQFLQDIAQRAKPSTATKAKELRPSVQLSNSESRNTLSPSFHRNQPWKQNLKTFRNHKGPKSKLFQVNRTGTSTLIKKEKGSSFTHGKSRPSLDNIHLGQRQNSKNVHSNSEKKDNMKSKVSSNIVFQKGRQDRTKTQYNESLNSETYIQSEEHKGTQPPPAEVTAAKADMKTKKQILETATIKTALITDSSKADSESRNTLSPSFHRNQPWKQNLKTFRNHKGPKSKLFQVNRTGTSTLIRKEKGSSFTHGKSRPSLDNIHLGQRQNSKNVHSNSEKKDNMKSKVSSNIVFQKGRQDRTKTQYNESLNSETYIQSEEHKGTQPPPAEVTATKADMKTKKQILETATIKTALITDSSKADATPQIPSRKPELSSKASIQNNVSDKSVDLHDKEQVNLATSTEGLRTTINVTSKNSISTTFSVKYERSSAHHDSLFLTEQTNKKELTTKITPTKANKDEKPSQKLRWKNANKKQSPFVTPQSRPLNQAHLDKHQSDTYLKTSDTSAGSTSSRLQHKNLRSQTKPNRSSSFSENISKATLSTAYPKDFTQLPSVAVASKDVPSDTDKLVEKTNAGMSKKEQVVTSPESDQNNPVPHELNHPLSKDFKKKSAFTLDVGKNSLSSKQTVTGWKTEQSQPAFSKGKPVFNTVDKVSGRNKSDQPSQLSEKISPFLPPSAKASHQNKSSVPSPSSTLEKASHKSYLDLRPALANKTRSFPSILVEKDKLHNDNTLVNKNVITAEKSSPFSPKHSESKHQTKDDFSPIVSRENNMISDKVTNQQKETMQPVSKLIQMTKKNKGNNVNSHLHPKDLERKDNRETNSVREESMKRVRTQTFRTPTAVMWFVTSHPAHGKIKHPLLKPSLTNIEIKVPDDITIDGSIRIRPNSTSVHRKEKKYQLPVLVEGLYKKNNYNQIAVDRVLKQEKSEEKKKRKYKFDTLKSRLELVSVVSESTDTGNDTLKHTNGKKQNSRKQNLSPFGPQKIKSERADDSDRKLDIKSSFRKSGKQNSLSQSGSLRKTQHPRSNISSQLEITAMPHKNDKGSRSHIGMSLGTKTKAFLLTNKSYKNSVESTMPVLTSKSGLSELKIITEKKIAKLPENTKQGKSEPYRKTTQIVSESFRDFHAQVKADSDKLFTSKQMKQTTPAKPLKDTATVKITTSITPKSKQRIPGPEKIQTKVAVEEWEAFLDEDPLQILKRLEEEAAAGRYQGKGAKNKPKDSFQNTHPKSPFTQKAPNVKILGIELEQDNSLTVLFDLPRKNRFQLAAKTKATKENSDSKFITRAAAEARAAKNTLHQDTKPVSPFRKPSARPMGQGRPNLLKMLVTPSEVDEGTQTQKTIVIRQPSGRVSSLYTSKKNGSVVDPRLLSKRRKTAAPMIDDISGEQSNGRVKQITPMQTLMSIADTQTTAKTGTILKQSKSSKIGNNSKTRISTPDSTKAAFTRKAYHTLTSTTITTTKENIFRNSTVRNKLNPNANKQKTFFHVSQKMKINPFIRNGIPVTSIVSSTSHTPKSTSTHLRHVDPLNRLLNQTQPSSTKEKFQTTLISSSPNTAASSRSPKSKLHTKSRIETVQLIKDSFTTTKKNVNIAAAKHYPTVGDVVTNSTPEDSAALYSTQPSAVSEGTETSTPFLRYSASTTTIDLQKLRQKNKTSTSKANTPPASTHMSAVSQTTAKATPTPQGRSQHSDQTETTLLRQTQSSVMSTTFIATQSTVTGLKKLQRPGSFTLPTGKTQTKHKSSFASFSSTDESVTTVLQTLRSKIDDISSTVKNILRTTSSVNRFSSPNITTVIPLRTQTARKTNFRKKSNSTKSPHVKEMNTTTTLSQNRTMLFSELTTVPADAGRKSRNKTVISESQNVGSATVPKMKNNPLLALFSDLSLTMPSSFANTNKTKSKSQTSETQRKSSNTSRTTQNTTRQLTSVSAKTTPALDKESERDTSSVLPATKHVDISTSQASTTTNRTLNSVGKSKETMASTNISIATITKNINGTSGQKNKKLEMLSSTLSPLSNSTESKASNSKSTSPPTSVSVPTSRTSQTMTYTTTSTPRKTTTPTMLLLTLPDWVTFPNKFKEMTKKTRKKTQSVKPTTTTASTFTTTKSHTVSSLVTKVTKKRKLKSKKKDKKKASNTKTKSKKIRTTAIPTKPPSKKKDKEKPYLKNFVLGKLLPKDILSALSEQKLGKKKGSNQNRVSDSPNSYATKEKKITKTAENTADKNARNKQEKEPVRIVKVLSTRPSFKDLQNSSEPGPKVIVPTKGLFVPRFIHYNNKNNNGHGNRTRHRVGISGSEARHVSMRVQQMSVGTVFSRYWPAILGLTVGTVFLVVALLTSIACRQQSSGNVLERLFVQRRQGWQQDTPQHLSEPPDTSEYASSASSLASDNTRSSINFT